MVFLYRILEKVYYLLEVLYFRKENYNPRVQVATNLGNHPMKILDMCTGSGENVVQIAKTNRESKVVGIDISRRFLKLARKQVEKKGLNNVELLVMDATKTSFQDRSFDVVVISLILHELEEKYAEKIMLEAIRLLKEDGIIVVVEWEIPSAILKKLAFQLIKRLEPHEFEKFIQQDMEQYFSKFGLYITDHLHCDYTQVIFLNTGTVSTL